ncbi:MAG: hypothetical protein LBV12_12935 [Puniceicoccales bacterium]|jgi:rhodanese-related sulfurtransferase|nr:hypothetical protein [Puniceicoccales bacterium]
MTQKDKLFQDMTWGLVMAVFSLVCGLAINFLREKPLPLKYEDKSVRLDAAVARLNGENLSVSQLGKTVTSGELEALLQQKANVILLDVRPDLFYEDSHIPGALNLSREDFEEKYPSMASKLIQADRVIVYCAGDYCEEAEMVAEALRKLGHKNLSIYPGGWAEWQRRKKDFSPGRPS